MYSLHNFCKITCKMCCCILKSLSLLILIISLVLCKLKSWVLNVPIKNNPCVLFSKRRDLNNFIVVFLWLPNRQRSLERIYGELPAVFRGFTDLRPRQIDTFVERYSIRKFPPVLVVSMHFKAINWKSWRQTQSVVTW